MSQRQPNFAAAADFIWRSARLIDRLRFAYHFLSGKREPVVAALKAYQNEDGGFGNALEPDLRAPLSQPAAVRTALEMLDEIDAFDPAIALPACDFLATITTSDGGLPFSLQSALVYPGPPWWKNADDTVSAPTFTAPIVGLLHKHGVEHAWLERATDYCWRYAETFDASHVKGSAWDFPRISTSYNARAILIFLDHAPDLARAEQAFAHISQQVLERKLVELDAGDTGEAHKPLDYAPRANCLARRLFADDVIEAHLDSLAGAQQSDGGWMFHWMDWNPTTSQEWRGWLTVEALLTLQSYGRLEN